MSEEIEQLQVSDPSGIIDITLLMNSSFFLTGEICSENVNQAIKWITYENLVAEEQKVLTLYINSEGGDLYQAFALIDVMRVSNHPIRVIGLGSVMSAAFLIFAAGTKGERYIGPNTGIMCHQFSFGSDEVKYHDIKAAMKEGDRANERMLKVLQEATGLPTSKIKAKLLPASDVYLTADEMIELGLADKLLTKVIL